MSDTEGGVYVWGMPVGRVAAHLSSGGKADFIAFGPDDTILSRTEARTRDARMQRTRRITEAI